MQKTRAFVIKTQDYRETSLLASFYTPDFGKVRAVVKGGRDGRFKYGSTLEPFSLNDIVVYRRRFGDLHLVTSVELVERYEGLRRDLERLGIAAYFMELVDQMTDTGLSNPDVFERIGEALALLEAGCDPGRAARIFEIRLMQHLGFMPYLEGCVRCDGPGGPEPYFSISSGGIVCAGCRSGEGPLVRVSEEAVALLNEARMKPMTEAAAAESAPETSALVGRVMRQFVDYHLEYKPRSLVFLEKIGAA